MLNDEAINTSLEWEFAQGNGSVIVLNSFFFDPGRDRGLEDTASIETHKQTRRQPALEDPSRYRFLAPIHHPLAPHWTLVSINFKDPAIDHYDSLTSPRRFTLVTDYIKAWMRRIDPSLESREIKCNNKVCAQQYDSISCGVFTIAFAVALMNGKQVPQALDIKAIRTLRDYYSTQLNLSLSGDSSVTIASTLGRGRTLFQASNSQINQAVSSTTFQANTSARLETAEPSRQHDASLNPQFNTHTPRSTPTKMAPRKSKAAADFNQALDLAQAKVESLRGKYDKAKSITSKAAEAVMAANSEWVTITTNAASRAAQSSGTYIQEQTNLIFAASEKHQLASRKETIAKNGTESYRLMLEQWGKVVEALGEAIEVDKSGEGAVADLDKLMEEEEEVYGG